MINNPLALLMLTLLLGGVPISGLAQESAEQDNVVSIKNRFIPELEPLGLMLGSIIVNPELEIQQDYDDNIFRTDTNEQSDVITSIRPSIALRTNWDLHQISFNIRGDVGLHQDNSAEDFEDMAARLAARYDMDYETFLNTSFSHALRHEERGDPNDVNGDEPTKFSVTTSQVGFTRALGRLKLFLLGEYRDIDFEDSNVGGVVIDNDGRDRSQYLYQLRLAYELAPNYDVFVRSIRDIRRYDELGAVDRDSNGYRIDVGTGLNLSGKARADLFAGYIRQNYNGLLEDIRAINFGGSLLWNLGDITSLRARANRDVLESVNATTSGYVRTGFSLSAEHALRRHLILDASLGFQEDDFVSIGPDRVDETSSIGLSLEYRPFRGAALGSGYAYTDRESSTAGADFTNNVFRVYGRYTY